MNAVMVQQLLLLRQQAETSAAAVLRRAREEVVLCEEEFLQAQECVETLERRLSLPLGQIRAEQLLVQELAQQTYQEAVRQKLKVEQRLALAERHCQEANRAYQAACAARKATEEELQRMKKREQQRLELQQENEALERLRGER